MRGLAAFLAVATLATGCGGSSSNDGGTTGPTGNTGPDFAGNFVATWYGTVSATINGSTQSGPGTQPITVSGANQISIAALCTSGSAVPATVTGPSTFSIASFDCPHQAGTCQGGGTTTLTETFRTGTGQLSQAGTLTITITGVASACGTTQDFTVTFTGSKTPPKK
jgi:hypothetical protein